MLDSSAPYLWLFILKNKICAAAAATSSIKVEKRIFGIHHNFRAPRKIGTDRAGIFSILFISLLYNP